MFIASAYWSGSLNVSQLRQFETEDEAWQYLVNDVKFSHPSFVRVYEVFNDKEPRLCKIPDKYNPKKKPLKAAFFMKRNPSPW